MALHSYHIKRSHVYTSKGIFKNKIKPRMKNFHISEISTVHEIQIVLSLEFSVGWMERLFLLTFISVKQKGWRSMATDDQTDQTLWLYYYVGWFGFWLVSVTKFLSWLYYHYILRLTAVTANNTVDGSRMLQLWLHIPEGNKSMFTV